MVKVLEEKSEKNFSHENSFSVMLYHELQPNDWVQLGVAYQINSNMWASSPLRNRQYNACTGTIYTKASKTGGTAYIL